MLDGTTIQPSTTVTLLPHQQEFVNQVVNATPPARFLFTSPTGAGKTVALSASAGALQAKNGRLRCLAIVPAPLLQMWQDQLMQFAGLEAVLMTPQSYRRLQAESGGNVSVWSTVSCVVASIEFLKSQDRMDAVLAENWDLVILDEAHRSTKYTQRGNLAEKIWRSPGVGVAVAATSSPYPPEWLAADSGAVRIHWRFSDILGQGRSPERRIHAINYTTSDSERKVAGLVGELIRPMPEDQFTSSLLLRRLGSSMYALEQTIRRLLTAETFGDSDLKDWAAEDLDEDCPDTAATNSVRIDRAAAERILALLEDESSDSKWECCLQLLNDRGIGKTHSGIIFTDYADTAEYLDYLAKSGALNSFALTGSLAFDESARALREAKGSPSLLIVTGVIEGVDLSFSNQVIHYDLPWNPYALEQRIGRVERVGTNFEAFDHYFLHERSAVHDALSRMMERVRTIEEEWK